MRERIMTNDDVTWVPRFRDSVIIEENAHGEVLFILTLERKVVRLPHSELLQRLLDLIDGAHTMGEVLESAALSTINESIELGKVVGLLLRANVICRAEAELSPTRTHPGIDARYLRQALMFQDLHDAGATKEQGSLALHRRLRRSTVTVCGVGGLGSWVAAGLALAGIGKLRICDSDTVELSNLNRQVLYSPSDLGRSKTEAAASRLREVNPDVVIESIQQRLTSTDDVLAILGNDSDMLVSCADEPSVNELAEWVTSACLQKNVKHLIGGGYSYHIGALGLAVTPGLTACWGCLRLEVQGDHGRRGDSPPIARRPGAGSIGVLTGAVGNLVAWESIRLLLDLESTLSSNWVELDFTPIQFKGRIVPRRSDCDLCGYT